LTEEELGKYFETYGRADEMTEEELMQYNDYVVTYTYTSVSELQKDVLDFGPMAVDLPQFSGSLSDSEDE